MKTWAYLKPCILHEGPAGRCETQLGPLYVLCWPSESCPPPHLYLFYIGDSYIYWILRNNTSIISVTITQSCDTLVLTASSSSSSLTSSPFFFLPWERFFFYATVSFILQLQCIFTKCVVLIIDKLSLL